jgi:hypothetical protein
MSLSFSAVSFIREGFAVAAGAGLAAGAAVVVWADALCRLPATSSRATRQATMRSMGIPLGHFFD